jgi:pyridoxal phosphate enzyme (YggS family)
LASIRDNIREVQERIDRALRRCGRDGEEITIVAVTKNIAIDRIEEAIRAGLTVFGENRVQEAREKVGHFSGREITWHMIGHLQRNKAKIALSLFSLIHSLHSIPLAREISKRATRPVDVLLQVNTSGEGSKHGIRPMEMDQFLEQAEELPNIRIRGLMTIAPFTDDTVRIRRAFRTLFHLYEKARAMQMNRTEMCFLSMGMTGDYEVAVEEGSNMIRIGTALFGPRKPGGGLN